jgi:ubiquinone/menaquinone biosynthesis C-methylase UbiE
MTTSSPDHWSSWLLHRRHGDDPAELAKTHARLAPIRDRVLANGRVTAGDTVLDVGTGDGLIALGAMERAGSSGHVIFSDVSQDLLKHARLLADRMGIATPTSFVRASADDLSAFAGESVDVVTTRSVLAYVGNKRQAFAEFFRVLKPNGRISHYEPVNRLTHPEPDHLFDGYDIAPVQDLAQRINQAFEHRQPIDRDPMFDFDERDLLAFARDAGFRELHLELHVDVAPHTPQRWRTYAGSAANPLALTIEEAMAETLTPTERDRFVTHLRPLVERGEGLFSVAVTYLWGTKA